MGGIAAIGSLINDSTLRDISLSVNNKRSQRNSNLFNEYSLPFDSVPNKMGVIQQDDNLVSKFQEQQLENEETGINYNNQVKQQYEDNPNKLKNILKRLNDMSQNTN